MVYENPRPEDHPDPRFPEDHPDPRFRALYQEVYKAFERSTELEREFNSSRRWDDQLRFRFHTRKLEIEKDWLAALRALQQVDPSFRARDIAESIKDHEREVKSAAECIDQYNPLK